MPTVAKASPSRKINPNTCSRRAPNAKRIPISEARNDTRYDITPYTPIDARKMAIKANAPVSAALKRREPRDGQSRPDRLGIENRLIAIHGRDQFSKRPRQRRRVVRERINRFARLSEVGSRSRETQVHRGHHVLVQPGLADIADHSHDLRPARITWIGPNGAYPVPQGAGTGEKLPGKSLICDRH